MNSRRDRLQIAPTLEKCLHFHLEIKFSSPHDKCGSMHDTHICNVVQRRRDTTNDCRRL